MYITVKQAAEKWGISDRRVRILCSEGKISGATREGFDEYHVKHDPGAMEKLFAGYVNAKMDSYLMMLEIS